MHRWDLCKLQEHMRALFGVCVVRCRNFDGFVSTEIGVRESCLQQAKNAFPDATFRALSHEEHARLSRLELLRREIEISHDTYCHTTITFDEKTNQQIGVASVFENRIAAVRKSHPGIKIQTLPPDMGPVTIAGVVELKKKTDPHADFSGNKFAA